MKHIFIAAAFAVLLSSPLLSASDKIPLLQQQDVSPFGLMRSWFHQVKVLSSQSKIIYAIVEGGQMFIVTSDANIHVIDSESGQWLWTRGLGRRGQTLIEPAVNSKVIAICNGLDMFVFGRKSGKLLYQVELTDIPSASLQMSENYLYIPLMNETISIIHLERITPQKQARDRIGKAADKRSKDIDDPGLKKIVEQFEEAKESLRQKAAPVEEEPDIVINSEHRIPITCASMGLMESQPILTRQIFEPGVWLEQELKYSGTVHSEMLSWVTKQGFLYTAGIDNLSEKEATLRYQVNSSAQTYYVDSSRTYQREMPGHKAMMASPAVNQLVPANDDTAGRVQVPGIIVTGGRATYIFAVNVKTGNVLWQFPTRGELTEPIGIIGRDVYAPVKSPITKGGLHHFDLLDGVKVENRQVDERKFWFAPNVSQFVAASKERLYALDSAKHLVILDKETGTVLHRFDIRVFERVLFNVETDQIFLIKESGLVQCLREQVLDASDNETLALTVPSLRHRLSCEQFAAISDGKAWTGDTPPIAKKQDGRDKPADDAAEEVNAPEQNSDTTGKEYIQLWWEDALPPSALKRKELKNAEPKETESE